jgi:hypothetical protein
MEQHLKHAGFYGVLSVLLTRRLYTCLSFGFSLHGSFHCDNSSSNSTVEASSGTDTSAGMLKVICIAIRQQVVAPSVW